MQGRRRGWRSRRLGIGRKQRWLLRAELRVVLREELRAELREELLLEGVSAAARKTPRKTRRKLLEEPEDPGELPAGPGARCLAGGALPAWRRTTPVRTSSHIIAP